MVVTVIARRLGKDTTVGLIQMIAELETNPGEDFIWDPWVTSDLPVQMGLRSVDRVLGLGMIE